MRETMRYRLPMTSGSGLAGEGSSSLTGSTQGPVSLPQKYPYDLRHAMATFLIPGAGWAHLLRHQSARTGHADSRGESRRGENDRGRSVEGLSAERRVGEVDVFRQSH